MFAIACIKGEGSNQEEISQMLKSAPKPLKTKKWLSPYENLSNCRRNQLRNLKQNACANLERSVFTTNGLSLNSNVFQKASTVFNIKKQFV